MADMEGNRKIVIDVEPRLDSFDKAFAKLDDYASEGIKVNCALEIDGKLAAKSIEEARRQLEASGKKQPIHLQLDFTDIKKSMQSAQNMAKKTAQEIADYFDTATKGKSVQSLHKDYSFVGSKNLSKDTSEATKQLIEYRNAAFQKVQDLQFDFSDATANMDIDKVEAYGKSMHELITILTEINNIAGRKGITFPDFDISADIQNTTNQLEQLKAAFTGKDWFAQVSNYMNMMEKAQQEFLKLPELFGATVGTGNGVGNISTEEITAIITLLGELKDEIISINQSFGKIDESSGVTNLLTYIQNIDSALSNLSPKLENTFDSIKTNDQLSSDLDNMLIKLNDAQTEITELKSKLATATNSGSIELTAIDNLEEKVRAVTQAVEDKTSAFEMEAATVTSSVSREGEAVQALADRVKEVSDSVKAMANTVQTGLGKSGGGFTKLAEGLEKLSEANFDIKKLEKLKRIDLSGIKGVNPKVLTKLTSSVKRLSEVSDYSFVTKINKLDFSKLKSASVPKSFDNMVKGLKKLSQIENLKDLKKINDLDLSKLSGFKIKENAFDNLAAGLERLAKINLSSLTKSLKGLDLTSLANIANIKDIDTTLSGMSKSFMDTQSKQINSAINKYEKLAAEAPDGSDKTDLLKRVDELKQLRLLLNEDFTPAGLSKMTDIDANMRSMVQQIQEAISGCETLAASMAKVANGTKTSNENFSKYKKALQEEASLRNKQLKNGELNKVDSLKLKEAETLRKSLFDDSDKRYDDLRSAYYRDLKNNYVQALDDAISQAQSKIAGKTNADFVNSEEFTKVENTLTRLIQLKEQFLKTDEIKGADDKMDSAFSELQELKDVIDSISSKRTTTKGTIIGNVYDTGTEKAIAQLKELIRLQEEAKGNKVSFGKTKNDYSGLDYSVTTKTGELQKYTATIESSTGAVTTFMKSEEEYVSQGQKFINSIKGKFAELTRYISVMEVFQKVLQFVKQGITAVREINTAMTDLKKVTDETSESYSNFGKIAGNIATEVGGKTSDIISSTADYARLGYDLEESTELAKNTAIYKNVGDGIDIDTATEDIVSITKAYGIAAEESMDVIDILNEVGNNYAISSSGLGEGLRRSSSALAAGNNTFEESVAMLAAMNEVLQDPALAGTTLKMLSLRIRGAKTEIEAEGESVDGMAESTSKLREQILALTNVSGQGGFDIMTDGGKSFKSTYDIMLGISKVWKEMSDIDQASLLELIAGKNRAQGAAALLDSMSTAESALQSAYNATGSAAKENEKYLESIDGKISILQANFQNLWTNAIDSKALTFFIDLGSSILNLIDNVGLLETAIAAVVSIMSIKGAGGANLTVVPKLKTPAINCVAA